MADYIPTTDPEKVNWLKDLALWLNANGLAHGFTQQQIDDFQAMASDSDDAYAEHLAAKLTAHAATVNKNTVLGQAIAIARDYAQKLQHDLTMTDAQRAADTQAGHPPAGITVPDPHLPRCYSSISASATKSRSTGDPIPGMNAKMPNRTGSWAAKSNMRGAASRRMIALGLASAWTRNPR